MPSQAGSLRAPAHAGSLRLQERAIFALIFALMVGFVAVVTVSALNARYEPAVTTPSGLSHVPVSSGSTTGTAARAQLEARLATALRPEVSTDHGALAVGVIDVTTAGMATYNATRRFHTGSIVTADILAAWLLQHEHSGTPVRAQDASLAAQMIENRSSAAADRLWRLVGGMAGVQAANQVLKLRHTSVAKDGKWAKAATTVIDQLQLLTDLTSARSPLDATARAYAVGLLDHEAKRQRWGVAMAASPGTTFAVSNSWLLDPRLAVVDSIGVVRRDGQELLIVVLSKNNPTVGAGIARAEAAAMTAAKVVTSSS